MHFQSTLVMDESYLAEVIHKEAYPRMRGTHHLCQHFMALFTGAEEWQGRAS